jgi:dienelactone hydrolase
MVMASVNEIVDGIPVLLVEAAGPGRDVVLWMSHLGGSAEQTLPMLERFAGAGHPAVSFDGVGHGSRGSGDPWELAAGVLAAFRRRMWPILGQTTLEAMRVLSWAQERTGAAGAALAGGVSMGGDVAVALAGIDPRVVRVATVGSSPDWSRPGMRDLRDSTRVVDQGAADPYSQWFADQLDPMRHLERYRGGAALGFELGGADHHIPQENAQAFADALRERPGVGPERLRLNVHPGLDHLGVTTSAEALESAAGWLLAG